MYLEPKEYDEKEIELGQVSCFNEEHCDWLGDVDAVVIGDILHWYCPECNYYHEEYYSEEDYYDYPVGN